MELYDAISYRKSTRKYSSESINAEAMETVIRTLETAERLYNNIDMQILLVKDGWRLHDLIPGIVGGYGKVKAPHYLIITSEEKEGYLQNIGYTLQGVVLKLTTMNLATCWLGGCIRKELLSGIVDIPKGQVPQLMIAFGNAEKGKSPFRGNPSNAKRKDVSEITTGTMDITWSKIVSAIRLAPSAVNTQPWRFIFTEGKIHVYSAGSSNILLKHILGARNLIDIGIALCHAMVAARHFSRNIRFTLDNSNAVKGYDYVTTIIEV